jgi:hypothetical protein
MWSNETLKQQQQQNKMEPASGTLFFFSSQKLYYLPVLTFLFRTCLHVCMDGFCFLLGAGVFLILCHNCVLFFILGGTHTLFISCFDNNRLVVVFEWKE